MGGSMGMVVGEKIARLMDYALRAPPAGDRLRGLGRRADAGGRALADADGESRRALSRGSASARIPYISVLCDPTTGGVAASFARLGDLNLAEPGAVIGFAGRRVIEQTTNQELPDDFQTRGVPDGAWDARRDRAAA